MPKQVAADIVTALCRRIDAGEWSETRRLPNERELALEYGVARNTMRRALNTIVAHGIVSRHVGRGTFLTSEDTGTIGKLVSGIAGASPVDMMAVRAILEPRATALAASNASTRELQEIADAYEASIPATEMAEFEHWDAEIHQRIFAGSRNELLAQLHDLLRLIRGQAPWLDLKRRSFSLERREIYCVEHGAVVEALLRRNAEEASSAMRAHLGTVYRNLFGNPF